jgi:hypothetical protein
MTLRTSTHVFEDLNAKRTVAEAAIQRVGSWHIFSA